MKFKLITYNIWDGTHLDVVLEFLKREQAEVYQLQEVGITGKGLARDQKTNILTRVNQELNLEGIYQRMFWGDHGQGKFDMGVATWSRWPVQETVTFNYERPATEEMLMPAGKDRYNLPRVILGVKVKLPGRDLWCFNTHFTISPEATVTEHQLENARRVKGFLENYPEYILTGDMNTPFQSETYKVLSKGLKDVSLGELSTLHPTIHPVGNLGYHVDYVFIKGARIKHEGTRIPLEDGSDHLPVVVDLNISTWE
jgi:endonuclease/exonuclease/phosphatase family metal-dependent hydrolase